MPAALRLVGISCGFIAATLPVLLGAAPAAAIAEFSGIGDLLGGAFFSQIFALSADGLTAVGRSESGDGREAVRWTESGGLESLGSLTAAPDDFATGVSGDGSAISGLADTPLGGTEVFHWTGTTGMVGLGDLPGGAFDAQGLGMSADGTTIIGHGESASGQEAFYWTAGTGLVGLGDLDGGGFWSTARGVSPDGSVIVGSSESANGREATIWTQATGLVPLGDLPGGAFESQGLALSADGFSVVGAATPAGAIREAYRWTEATGMVPLGDLPGGDVNSTAFAVSADGSVVGGTGATTFDNAGDFAFVWVEDVGLFDVKMLLESEYGLDLGDWTLVAIRGISDDSLVWAGVGINPNGQEEGWIASVPYLPEASVPEPGTLVLLAASVLFLLNRPRGDRDAGAAGGSAPRRRA